MKKLLLLFLVAFTWTIQASAEKISEQDAYAIAQQFFSTKGLTKGSTPANAQLQLTHTSTSYYAFNRGEANGFIIVAADDNFNSQVLGYTDQGSFNADSIPANMRWWLSEYDRVLKAAQEAGINHSAKGIKVKATHTNRPDIDPLVSARWNQDSPYNGMCPTYNGRRCYTGCLATAIAQIVYHNRYPVQGVGSHSYEWFVGSNSQGSLSVNFGQSTYDYDAMSDTYNNASSQASRNAVAKLMYHIGVASNMAYGTDASGAFSSDGALGLIRNFNYDKSAIVLCRDFYSDEEWIEMLYNELSEERPLYYAGTNENAGHAFVCDGYQYRNGNDYFHINWGWGGYNDAYFLIDALDPEGQGIGGSDAGYNQQQEVIFNLKPAQSGSEYVTLLYNYIDFDIEEKNQTFSARNVFFTGAFYNYSLVSKTLTFGIKVVDSNNQVTWVEDKYKEDYEPLNGSGAIIIDMNKFPTAEGTYTVYPAYKNEKGEWQEIRTINTSNKKYLIATVEGNNITFSNPVESRELEFTNWQTTPVYAGEEFSVRVDITNYTGETFADNISFVLLNYGTVDVVSYSAEQAINLPNGSSTTASFTLTAPEEAGYYDFVVINSEWNTICDIMTMRIDENPNTGGGTEELTLSLVSLEVANAESVSIANINITAQIECHSGSYSNGLLAFAVFPETGGESIDFKTQDFSISAGETKTETFSGTFSGLEQNTTYFTAVFYYNLEDKSWYQITGGTFFTTSDGSAIDEINNDNTPVETSVYNLSGIRLLHFDAGEPLDSSSLEPGIYIVKSGNQTHRIIINK